MTFVVYQPGEFVMGSPDTELKRGNEPQHRVRITRPFAICDREVSVEQWLRFGAATKRNYAYSRYHSPTPKHTVVATWYSAVEYCRWLTEQAGMSESEQCYEDPEKLAKGPDGHPLNWPFHPERAGFRLPTEAEWEYACRAGTSTTYGFGSDSRLLGKYGWFVDNSGEKNHVGGELRPNLRGLFDMHGNVYEWCHDWYAEYHRGDSVDPVGPQRAQVTRRVLRGGGWNLYAWMCRSALRHDDGVPSAEYVFMGFRVARTHQ